MMKCSQISTNTLNGFINLMYLLQLEVTGKFLTTVERSIYDRVSVVLSYSE